MKAPCSSSQVSTLPSYTISAIFMWPKEPVDFIKHGVIAGSFSHCAQFEQLHVYSNKQATTNAHMWGQYVQSHMCK